MLETIVKISDWIWGPPMIILLFLSGIFLTFRLGFFHIKHAGYIFKQTVGGIFKKQDPLAKAEGTISPFQALTSALACTIGAGNIVGVPVAIMLGGPGAIFWMWVIALLAGCIKFSEVVLAVKYREKNAKGEYVGGPMYYITKGLNMKWLGVWFAAALMFEVAASNMVQANSLALSVKETFNINPAITGIIAMILVGAVIIGGIKRIGSFTEKFVPIMVFIYLAGAFIIVISNINMIGEVFGLIFTYAFKPMAAVGGFGGAVIAQAIRHGFARGVYSNEAGVGTAPIAHATATTDHPVRQGLWGLAEVVIDTLVVCTATAFVILSTGVWKAEGAGNDPSALTSVAFAEGLGTVGGYIVTVSLLFFVVSTVIVLSFYGEKQAEFLFGHKAVWVVKVIYVLSIFVGAIGGARVMWSLLDISLAAMAIPNIIALLLLSKEVVRLKNEYFSSPEFYLKDIGKGK
ncbi:alanine/glycine:cation symporter family protein [Pseudogracilibacillus auburnensis]|uniref:AGCS family alanine or glycine:cation symporter n=1 Tax=Pseudogracilibacillus auburnensis TaxID=1494959 RepID=A0A2V3W533_9BACI|nr:sodium:alanine symporter family protein [Pseudogracilibacillus auburnensis]MBO1005252.1 sodium:alanine symporter family protein [Pseudogracilibacillus auburnensis]PXW88131.1 AGCS family alanine or glycine:cation symporter [Pseudogracilibacillus auburnensis]